jgi:hypothetical protein
MAHKIYVFAGHIKGSTPFQAISPDGCHGRKTPNRERIMRCPGAWRAAPAAKNKLATGIPVF